MMEFIKLSNETFLNASLIRTITKVKQATGPDVYRFTLVDGNVENSTCNPIVVRRIEESGRHKVVVIEPDHCCGCISMNISVADVVAWEQHIDLYSNKVNMMPVTVNAELGEFWFVCNTQNEMCWVPGAGEHRQYEYNEMLSIMEKRAMKAVA